MLNHGARSTPAVLAKATSRSLRLVVVVDFPVELHLITNLELGEERKRESDGDLQLARMGQIGDLPVDVPTKTAAGFWQKVTSVFMR
jgi:hypothetical protein